MEKFLSKLSCVAMLASVLALSACEGNSPSENKTLVAPKGAVVPDLKVIEWGPHSALVGDNPNQMPDGSIGIWMKVTGADGLGEAQILFGGQPANSVAISSKGDLMTGTLPKDYVAQVGTKDIVIKQISTGKTFPVGTFVVTSSR